MTTASSASRPHRTASSPSSSSFCYAPPSFLLIVLICCSIWALLFHSVERAAAQGDLSALQAAPRHSFEPPFGRTIANWNAGAGAYVNTSYVRITPAKQSRTGYLWNVFPCSLVDWMVELEFSVTGLRNLGGDGFAFWFVERPEMLGNVYGSVDFWTGLGVFFDTFNNDGVGSNPLISAVYNDGTQRYDYASDGSSQALSTCSFDFRNLNDPAAARIRFENKKLTVDVAVALDRDGQHKYSPCISVENVELGTDKYFGITAHTGEVADNHDVFSFKTYDLSKGDVDIGKVRASYQQVLNEQHAQPTHQDMSVGEFQHNVLTMLSQMQEEINLIQVTELHISDWVYTQEERMGFIGVAGVRPGGTEPPKLPTPESVNDKIAALLKQSDDTSSKINMLSDAQNSVLREIKQITSSLGQRGGTTSNMPAGGNSGTGASVDGKELSNQLRSSTESLSSMARKLDEQLNALKADIGRMQQSVAVLATGGSSVEGSGIGWLPYLMLSLTTFCVASLTYHTFTQHMKNHRYKFP